MRGEKERPGLAKKIGTVVPDLCSSIRSTQARPQFLSQGGSGDVGDNKHPPLCLHIPKQPHLSCYLATCRSRPAQLLSQQHGIGPLTSRKTHLDTRRPEQTDTGAHTGHKAGSGLGTSGRCAAIARHVLWSHQVALRARIELAKLLVIDSSLHRARG